MKDVTQADRDAVQAFHRVTAARLFDDIKNDARTLGEDLGDEGDLVQAFARHRTEALTTQAAEITALRAEVERSRGALEWYGEQARLCRLTHSEGDKGRFALNEDGGERARQALGEQP